MAINWRIVMNKTRYKIATLTGSAVMAAMLLSLLILNIVFNKKIELRAAWHSSGVRRS